MAKQKTDLFKFFDHMNRGDYDYVDSLTEDEVKGLSAFVVLMWVNGAEGSNAPYHVLLTDMYCNPYVFSLSRHPRLLLKLLVAANSGMGNTRYAFKKNGIKNHTKELYAISRLYQCGMHEAKQYHEILNADEIEEIVDIFDFKE